MSDVDIHLHAIVVEFMTLCCRPMFQELGKAGEEYELNKLTRGAIINGY